MLVKDNQTSAGGSMTGQPHTSKARRRRYGVMRWNSNVAKLIALALLYLLMMLQERQLLPTFIDGSRPDTSSHRSM